MSRRRFAQVDVFGAAALQGNPVAVVLDGDDLTDAERADFSRWTNLSETTFVSSPTRGGSYAVRIRTVTEELPFAGALAGSNRVLTLQDTLRLGRRMHGPRRPASRATPSSRSVQRAWSRCGASTAICTSPRRR